MQDNGKMKDNGNTNCKMKDNDKMKDNGKMKVELIKRMKVELIKRTEGEKEAYVQGFRAGVEAAKTRVLLELTRFGKNVDVFKFEEKRARDLYDPITLS